MGNNFGEFKNYRKKSTDPYSDIHIYLSTSPLDEGNMKDMPALASKFSKTMPFRQKMYRIRLVYLNKTYNIVDYDHLSMFNNNEDIWEKHEFFVRNFFTFWRAI